MPKKDGLAVPLRKFLCVLFLIILQALTLPGIASAQQITLRGSDTLIYLGQRFAAVYSRTFPGLHIGVLGGGWTPALNAIASGQGDVAQVENTPPAPLPANVIAFPVGVQAIVVYVNEANPVRELTIGQVRSIFVGEITNWKSFGGPDARILLYAGESTTGTLAYFQDSVLRGEEPYPFEGKANTKALLDEIAARPEAIGYGSLASRTGVRAVAIKFGPTSLGIEPTEDAIRARTYPLTRHVSWAAPRKRDANLDAFCRWVLSSEGQLVVEASGFEPLLPAERQKALAKLGGATVVTPVGWNKGQR